MFSHGGEHPPKFFEISSGKEKFGFAWVCISDARQVLKNPKLRGFLIKKSGFSISDRNYFEPYFGRTVINRRITGEVIVKHTNLIPNAARSDFEHNSSRQAFLEALPKFILEVTSWANKIQDEDKAKEVLAQVSEEIVQINKTLRISSRDRVNVPSIMSKGILSHKHAKKINHNSVAMEEIQDRREKKVVPGGRPLHEYVNLYFHARNPMLYVRRSHHIDLCILCVGTQILDLPGVVIADRNASSDYARFAPAPHGLSIVDKETTFAEYWTHQDPFEAMRRKSAKCAEVLVPDRIDPCLIMGAYVSCLEAKTKFEALAVDIPVTVNSYLFFK